jgi:PPOX class probable F420-dependent enzyme
MSGLVDAGSEFGRRAAARLAAEEVVWLVTVDPRGVPQPTPVWFLWDGEDELVIKSQPARAKLRNVRAHPAVALHLNATPTGGDVVVLTGTAEVDEGGPTDAERSRFDEKYADAIRGLGMTPDGFHADYSATVRVRAQRLRGF